MSHVPRERVATSGSLVVLTRDAALTQTLKALGLEHPLVTVEAESDLASELMGTQTSVVIIDAGSASSPVERLTERLKSQFPDLVLIVAGRRDDQSALAAQVASGTVYRFLPKPVSPQRVKLFVDAACRRGAEALSGMDDSLAVTDVLDEERAPAARNTFWFGVAVLAALLIAGVWFMRVYG